MYNIRNSEFDNFVYCFIEMRNGEFMESWFALKVGQTVPLLVANGIEEDESQFKPLIDNYVILIYIFPLSFVKGEKTTQICT